MARRRHEERKEFSGINVTPLMDLTFLLLIVFMITAPVLEYSIDITPPQMDAEDISEDDSILIGLTSEGEFLYEGNQVTLEQLSSHLEQLRATQPNASIFIRADQDRPYREVVLLMKTIKDQGLHNIALMTRREED